MRKRKPTIKDHILLAIDYYDKQGVRNYLLKELWKHVLDGDYEQAMWHHFELLFIDEEIAELEQKLRPADSMLWSTPLQLDLLLNHATAELDFNSFRLHPGLRDI